MLNLYKYNTLSQALRYMRSFLYAKIISIWVLQRRIFMEEIWKPIDKYEGYEVSNLGRIKSYKVDKVNGIIMKPYKDTKGYLQIDISLDGRKRNNRVHLLVHRLVATAFIPNINNLPQVNHKDENKENNRVENLEWCTNEYNINYGTHNERVANAIRIDIYSVDKDGNIEHFHGVREAGRQISGRESGYVHISDALKGRRKTAFGRRWFYAA